MRHQMATPSGVDCRLSSKSLCHYGTVLEQQPAVLLYACIHTTWNAMHSEEVFLFPFHISIRAWVCVTYFCQLFDNN